MMPVLLIQYHAHLNYCPSMKGKYPIRMYNSVCVCGQMDNIKMCVEYILEYRILEYLNINTLDIILPAPRQQLFLGLQLSSLPGPW